MALKFELPSQPVRFNGTTLGDLFYDDVVGILQHTIACMKLLKLLYKIHFFVVQTTQYMQIISLFSLYDRSPLKINLSPILTECIPILASFLRKSHRALRLSTLQCLDVLVKHYGRKCKMFNDIQTV